MNIKTFSSVPALLPVQSASDQTTAFKVGQRIGAKVIPALIQTEINRFALRIADQSLLIQSNSPVTFPAGETLQLQVASLFPVTEFLLISNAAGLSTTSPARLTLVGPLVKPALTLSDLPSKQPVTATVVALTKDAVQLQILPAPNLQSAAIIDSAEPFILTFEQRELQRFLTASITIDAKKAKPVTDAVLKTPPYEALKPGQTVRFEISDQGRIQLFKILNVNPAPTLELPALIKQLLPKHEPASVLLNELIAKLPSLPQYSASLAKVVETLLENLPSLQQLANPETLQQAVAKSGLYLEAQLAALTGQAPEAMTIPQDLKSDLLKLAEELVQTTAALPIESPGSERTLLAQLQLKTDNVLAKVLLDQLNSLPKDETPKPAWTFDIPYLDRDRTRTLGLQIQHDRQTGNSSENRNWTVTLTFTPPGLGLIQCRLCYFDHTVNTFFYSQQTQTTDLIDKNLDFLKHLMEEAGLKPGLMHNQHGLQTQKPVYSSAEANFVDLKA